MGGVQKQRSLGLTLATAALYLGVDDDTPYRLRALGHLPGRRRRRGGYIYVPRSALLRFVQTPLCWLYVAPSDIPDPELRAAAVQARAATPGRWWPVIELAAHYYVHPSRVRAWRRQGWSSGYWTLKGRTSGGWWLWAVIPPPPPHRAPLTLHSVDAKRRLARRSA